MMKKINLKYAVLGLASLSLIACDNDFDESVADGELFTAGEADFSNYVTVGNSLTAGFADGGLYIDGQVNSYPNIIAQQMELAGGGEFIQPLVDDNSGGLLAAGAQILPNRFVLAVDANGNPGPARYTGEAATTDITNTVTGPLNNYGVAGAKSFHLAAPGYGNLAGVITGTANPYYVRFASSASATVIGDAVAADPSFFTLWIGNNDILSYATSGGSGDDTNETGNLDPNTYGGNDITNTNVFAAVYQDLVQDLVATGAKGALVNIPDVTSIPFFTTVPNNPIPLDALTAGGVNMAYAQYNAGLQQARLAGFITDEEADERTINFVEGQNGVVFTDDDLTDLSLAGLPSLRQTNAGDLLTFTSATVVGSLADPSNPQSVIGVGVPLGGQFVLSDTEQDRITAAQSSYNATIEALAAANDLAFVDARSALAGVANGGVSFNGGTLTSTYASGGAFSLDGVHPTPRGYAFTANVIMEAINAQYGSNLPPVEIGDYRSVTPSNLIN